MNEAETARDSVGELDLDPFAFQPGKASAIVGLGGADPHDDPGYAFHTDYVHAAEGPCHFNIRFSGLTAKNGTLQLRVHMFVDDDNPRLLLGNSARLQFNRLIQQGSTTYIRFDGFRNVRYALYGNILGATDARADALRVTLDRPASDDDEPVSHAAELRNTDYGHGAARPVSMMVSSDPPTLLYPESQSATKKQLRESVYAEWNNKLGMDTRAPRNGWAAAYVLQALRSYGMLEEGARGLAFGASNDAMIEVVRSLGSNVDVGTVPERSDELPGSFVNYDFLWSVDALARRDEETIGATIISLMQCLRPGGLAVHVLPFLTGTDQRSFSDVANAIRRGDAERITLSMISRNFEAARLKISCVDPIVDDTQSGLELGAFGLIFRKPAIRD
jgi:hypothetical protein